MTARKNTKEVPAEIIEVEVEAEATFSPKDLASELNIDAKTFRRFLRSQTEDRANKGGRWIFTAEVKDQLIAAYNTRTAGTTPTLVEADAAN